MRYTAILAAAAILGTTSGAALADFDCGALPNARWSWSTSTDTSGGVAGEVEYNTHGNVGTVTTSAIVETTTCNAVNPGGQIDPDHSYVSDPVEITPATTETVCNPGHSLPDCPL